MFLSVFGGPFLGTLVNVNRGLKLILRLLLGKEPELEAKAKAPG